MEKQIGAILKDAWRQREIADYSDVAEFTRDEAQQLLHDAEAFVTAIQPLLESPDS